jgi:hypothetical protein
MRTYDLVMTHKLDADDWFIHCVQRACADRRLNFFLVEPLWVESFLHEFDRRQLWARVLLNMHSEHHQPDDIFHRLVRLASRHDTRVIDPLDTALAAIDKASMHYRLIHSGIHTPYSVVVPHHQIETFRLNDAQRAALGQPFVIKPAMGYGRRGVILDATSESDLSRAAQAWPDHSYLLQQRIQPRLIDGAPAYYRIFYVFGSTFTCCWNCYNDHYGPVETIDIGNTPLWPLDALAHRIAELTGMNFFSSEVALTPSGEFVAIDYVNDQCHMLSQSANPQIGVPDDLVAAIAERLVQGACQLIGRA